LKRWQISTLEEITMEKSVSHQERARLRLARTPEFYRQFLDGFAESGLTVGQYCRKHHVGESTFHKYRLRAKRGPGKSHTQGKTQSNSPRMVRVLPAPISHASTHPFEIQLPNGCVFRLAHLDAALLAALDPFITGSNR
jgi:hypothetical protein